MVRFIALAASWWLTAVLLLIICAAYLAFSFGKNPYPAWVAFLFHTSGGISVLLVLIVNLAAASVRIAFTRLRRTALSQEYVRGLDVHAEVPVRSEGSLRDTAATFGFEALSSTAASASLRRVTGTWSFLPGTLSRAGLVLALIGLMMTAHLRRVGDVSLHEHEQKEILGSPVTLTGINAALPADYLQVGDEGGFLLEKVSATLSVDGRTAVVTPGFPARLEGHWYRIRHLGYSQALSVSLRGTRDDMTADLDLLPPGKNAIVSLPSGLAFLTFALEPDRTITKGLLTGRQYNLANPAYRVRAQEGRPRETVAGSRLRPGERAFVGPSEVTLGKQGLSVRIQAVSDPGLPFIYAGAIALLAGLCSMPARFFWYEREVAIVVLDGRIHIGARDEFFKKWGIERFQRLLDRSAERCQDGSI